MTDGYSATVRIYLELPVERLPVSANGRDWLRLAEPRVLPIGTIGTLVVEVDDVRDARKVWIGQTVDGQTYYERLEEA